MTDQIPVDKMNDVSLTREAIRDELGAQNAYDAYAEGTSDPKAKKVYEDISHEEGVHVGELAQVYSEQDPDAVKDMEEGRKEVKTMKSFREIYGDRRMGVLDKANGLHTDDGSSMTKAGSKADWYQKKNIETAIKDESKKEETPKEKPKEKETKPPELPSWAKKKKRTSSKGLTDGVKKPHKKKRGWAIGSSKNPEIPPNPWDRAGEESGRANNIETIERKKKNKMFPTSYKEKKKIRKSTESASIAKAEGPEEAARRQMKTVHRQTNQNIRNANIANDPRYRLPPEDEPTVIPNNPRDFWDQYRHTDSFSVASDIPMPDPADENHPVNLWQRDLMAQEADWKNQGWKGSLNFKFDPEKRMYTYNMPYFVPRTDDVDTSRKGLTITVPQALVDLWAPKYYEQVQKDNRKAQTDATDTAAANEARQADVESSDELFRSSLTDFLMNKLEAQGVQVKRRNAAKEVDTFLASLSPDELNSLRYKMAENTPRVLPEKERERMYDKMWSDYISDPKIREKLYNSGVLFNGIMSGGFGDPQVYENAAQEVKDEATTGKILQDSLDTHNAANTSWDTSEMGKRYNKLLNLVSGKNMVTTEGGHGLNIYTDKDGALRIENTDDDGRTYDITDEVRSLVESGLSYAGDVVNGVNTAGMGKLQKKFPYVNSYAGKSLEEVLSNKEVEPVKALQNALRVANAASKMMSEKGDAKVQGASQIQSQMGVGNVQTEEGMGSDPSVGTKGSLDRKRLGQESRAELIDRFWNGKVDDPVKMKLRSSYEGIYKDRKKAYAEENGISVNAIPRTARKDLKKESLDVAINDFLDSVEGKDFTGQRLGRAYNTQQGIEAEPVEVEPPHIQERKEEEKVKRKEQRDKDIDTAVDIDRKKETLDPKSPQDILTGHKLDLERPEASDRSVNARRNAQDKAEKKKARETEKAERLKNETPEQKTRRERKEARKKEEATGARDGAARDKIFGITSKGIPEDKKEETEGASEGTKVKGTVSDDKEPTTPKRASASFRDVYDRYRSDAVNKRGAI